MRGTNEERVERGVGELPFVQQGVDAGLAADPILEGRLVPVDLESMRREKDGNSQQRRANKSLCWKNRDERTVSLKV